MERKRVTSQDVADQAGVSRTTVSFVLNQVDANISPETRERVLQAAEKLGYVPNASARALARRKTYTLALVLIRKAHDLASDAFLLSMMQGLINVIRPAGFRLLLEPVADADEPDVYLNLVRARQIDGIILSGPRSDDQQLAELIRSGFPIVLLGQLENGHAYSVDVDNRLAAEKAVTYLIDKGHSRISCITNAPLEYTSATDRLEGYRNALQSHDIPFDPTLVRMGGFDAESGRSATCSLFKALDVLPTALFVASDVVAMGAMKAIQDLDLSIPEDIALVGFDDVPLARYTTPSLTTIRLPATELGTRVGEMILSRVQGTKPKPQHVILDTQLVIRKSG